MEWEDYKSIGEVSVEVGVTTQTLRFWESKFSQLTPSKHGRRHRYYTSDDIILITRIKKLLHQDGYTIKGAVKLVNENKMHAENEKSAEIQNVKLPNANITDIRKELLEIKALLEG